MTTYSEFTRRCLSLIKSIPKGKVAAYGQIATYAGDPRGARQVVRILNALSNKHSLPWHRLVNNKGEIALKSKTGAALQKRLLKKEGIIIGRAGKIDLGSCQWRPRRLS